MAKKSSPKPIKKYGPLCQELVLSALESKFRRMFSEETVVQQSKQSFTKRRTDFNYDMSRLPNVRLGIH